MHVLDLHQMTQTHRGEQHDPNSKRVFGRPEHHPNSVCRPPGEGKNQNLGCERTTNQNQHLRRLARTTKECEECVCVCMNRCRDTYCCSKTLQESRQVSDDVRGDAEHLGDQHEHLGHLPWSVTRQVNHWDIACGFRRERNKSSLTQMKCSVCQEHHQCLIIDSSAINSKHQLLSRKKKRRSSAKTRQPASRFQI